jgi:hypothetical protein
MLSVESALEKLRNWMFPGKVPAIYPRRASGCGDGHDMWILHNLGLLRTCSNRVAIG